jgi:hypothetical protein
VHSRRTIVPAIFYVPMFFVAVSGIFHWNGAFETGLAARDI